MARLHLAFRGSHTSTDMGMDLQIDQTPYHPPTAWPNGGTNVEQGFYGPELPG